MGESSWLTSERCSLLIRWELDTKAPPHHRHRLQMMPCGNPNPNAHTGDILPSVMCSGRRCRQLIHLNSPQCVTLKEKPNQLILTITASPAGGQGDITHRHAGQILLLVVSTLASFNHRGDLFVTPSSEFLYLNVNKLWPFHHVDKSQTSLF